MRFATRSLLALGLLLPLVPAAAQESLLPAGARVAAAPRAAGESPPPKPAPAAEPADTAHWLAGQPCAMAQVRIKAPRRATKARRQPACA